MNKKKDFFAYGGSDSMVVDGHSHVTLPIEEHLRAMDEAGIDKTILFRTMVHPEAKARASDVQAEMERLGQILSGSPSVANRLARSADEELFRTVSLHPDRFYCFGMVPVSMDADAMVACIKEQLSRHHILGLGEYTLPSGMLSRLEKVIAASACAGNLPVWVHCFNPITIDDIMQLELLAKRHPSVPVIIGHSGGSNWMEVIDIAKRNRNIYVDLSASFSSMVMKLTVEELPDKTFFGVDYPYGDMLLSRLMLERVVADGQTRRQVLGGNIMRLLKL